MERGRRSDGGGEVHRGVVVVGGEQWGCAGDKGRGVQRQQEEAGLAGDLLLKSADTGGGCVEAKDMLKLMR